MATFSLYAITILNQGNEMNNRIDLPTRSSSIALKDIVKSEELNKRIGIWTLKTLKSLELFMKSSTVGVFTPSHSMSCLRAMFVLDDIVRGGWCLDLTLELPDGLRIQKICFLHAGENDDEAVALIHAEEVTAWNYITPRPMSGVSA